ncbi:MAG: ASPIC/UnbV domain-containing protein [Balneolaceae bacterium]
MQEVKAGGSFQSTSTKSLFFGLANADVKQMTIRWPTGHVQVLKEVPSDTTLNIIED